MSSVFLPPRQWCGSPGSTPGPSTCIYSQAICQLFAACHPASHRPFGSLMEKPCWKGSIVLKSGILILPDFLGKVVVFILYQIIELHICLELGPHFVQLSSLHLSFLNCNRLQPTSTDPCIK